MNKQFNKNNLKRGKHHHHRGPKSGTKALWAFAKYMDGLKLIVFLVLCNANKKIYSEIGRKKNIIFKQPNKQRLRLILIQVNYIFVYLLKKFIFKYLVSS